MSTTTSPTLPHAVGAASVRATAMPPDATEFNVGVSSGSSPVGGTVHLILTPAKGAWPSGMVLTPQATGIQGKFIPDTQRPIGVEPAYFQFAPSEPGSGTLTAIAAFVAQGSGQTAPASTLTPVATPSAATAFTTALSSSSGTTGSAVTLTATPTGAAWPSGVVLTPVAAGFTGAFSPSARTPSGTTAATFAFTPNAAGSGIIGVLANPSMTTPAGLAYQAAAPAPTPTPAPAPTETGTLSGVPTAGTAGTALATSGTFSLTNAPSSGTTAYVGLFNVTGGAYQGALQAVTGSSGGLPTLTPASAAGAATYAVRLCADSAGATVLATSPNIAVVVAAPAPTPAPGQVTGLTLSVTSSYISASWNAPTSGAAVTAYKQQYRAVGSATWNTHTRNVTGSAYDLLANFYIGISPDTDYEVVITAIAAGVEGAPSATVATHTLAVPAPPGPTTALTAGSITSTSAFLSWTAPTSGGIPNGYQVENRTPPGSGAWVDPIAIGGAVSYTKTGLSPSTTYEFHVFAYNDGGSGAPSGPITITTAA